MKVKTFVSKMVSPPLGFGPGMWVEEGDEVVFYPYGHKAMFRALSCEHSLVGECECIVSIEDGVFVEARDVRVAVPETVKMSMTV